MRKEFRHLDKNEIKDIIVMHQQGVPKLQIAKKYKIDNSTVHYHVNKYMEVVGENEDPSFYAVIKSSFRYECKHPSLKCTVCGKANDNIHSEQSVTIRTLREELKDIKSRYGIT